MDLLAGATTLNQLKREWTGRGLDKRWWMPKENGERWHSWFL